MALVTLRSFRDPVDAELARARLELEGIPARLLDVHLVSVQWLYSNALGGVKLAVEEADLEEARRVLDHDASADVAYAPDAGGSRGGADACPSCGSSRVHGSRLQRRAAALALLTGLPLIAWRHRWICDACGHAWRPEPRASHEPRQDPPETLAAERAVHRPRAYPLLRGLFATLLGLAILWYVQRQIRGG